jgi:hypothetical protein
VENPKKARRLRARKIQIPTYPETYSDMEKLAKRAGFENVTQYTRYLLKKMLYRETGMEWDL